MRKRYKVTVNNETFSAYRGDVLLDAALKAGIDLPHDCRAGQCGSCAIQLIDGQVYCGTSNDPRHVLACQSRIIGDVEFVVEDLPAVDRVKGRVSAITQLTSEVLELRIDTFEPRSYLPGQYFRIHFRGFPERCYSPTVPMDRASIGRHAFHLHIRRIPDGRVSGALGRQIRKDHPVTITGPYGSAFLRPNLTNRLMLVATGTGFAPIWSIATAALAENPKREMIVIVGGKTLESLYMARALQRLAQHPNVKIIPTVSAAQKFTKSVRQGRPIEYMQDLAEDDIVYACGAPSMVEAVKGLAAAAGASCYAVPFVSQSNGDEEESVVSRALSWITGDGEENLLSRTLSWITGDSTAAMPPDPMEQPVEKAPSRGLREPEPDARPAPQLRAAPPPVPRLAPPRAGEPRPAPPPKAEQRQPAQHRPGSPPRSAPAYPPPVDLPQLSWMPGNSARSMPPEPEFEPRSAPPLRGGRPPAPRPAPQPIAEQQPASQHRPGPPPRPALDYLPPIDLPPLSWITDDPAHSMPHERMEEPEEHAPFRSFREPEPAPRSRPAPPLWGAPPAPPPAQQYPTEPRPAPSPFAEPSPNPAPAYRPPVEPPPLALNWEVGDSNPPVPPEPVEKTRDEEAPFPGFREPEPAPRPARPVWAAPRRVQPYPAEPEPVPQPTAEQRLAPQPSPESQPAPRPVEVPSRSAPVQLDVPPRPQPRPQPPVLPQAEAPLKTAIQSHGEAPSQLRELQPPARKTRPVFIFIPNESQGIRAKPAANASRYGEAEVGGEGSVLSKVSTGATGAVEPAISDRLGRAPASERSERPNSDTDADTAAPESTSASSNRSDDDADSATASVRAGGGGNRVFRLT
jgi:NAD(P)H-flavin reductase/ferredoxin